MWGARVRVSPSPWPPPLGGPTSLGRRLLPGLEEGLVLPSTPLYKETPLAPLESIQINPIQLFSPQIARRLHAELSSPCALSLPLISFSPVWFPGRNCIGPSDFYSTATRRRVAGNFRRVSGIDLIPG